MHNGFNVTDDVTQFSFPEGTEPKFFIMVNNERFWLKIFLLIIGENSFLLHLMMRVLSKVIDS